MVNNFEDGIKCCHGYKIDAGNNSALVKIWDSVEDYFMNHKTVYFLKKSFRIYFNQLKDEKGKKKLPQDFIKISEMVLGHLRKLIDLNAKYDINSPLLIFLENFFRLKKNFGICNLYYTN